MARQNYQTVDEMFHRYQVTATEQIPLTAGGENATEKASMDVAVP